MELRHKELTVVHAPEIDVTPPLRILIRIAFRPTILCFVCGIELYLF
eukprot:UN09960